MYNPVDLRGYQNNLADDIRSAFGGGYRAPLVRLDTGGGKTRLFTHITWGATNKGNEVVAVAHRRELIEQISMTFADFAIPHRIVAPANIVRMIKVAQFRKHGRSFVDPRGKAVVASVQTLVGHLACINPKLLIIDEAHHLTGDNQWGRVAAAFPMAKLLPVTATPVRADGKGLGIKSGGFADVMLHGPPMRWLIDNGYLSDYRIYAADVGGKKDGFHTQYGDHKKSEVSAEYSKPKIIGNAIDHYLEKANGMPCVTFCSSVQNAELTAQQYRAAGIKAVSVDGSMEDDDRSRRIKGLADGTVEVLTSADLIGEGLDIPGIVAVQLLRPTKSLSLFMQQIGRGLRALPGKEWAIILDHVGAVGMTVNGIFVPNHGLPDEERDWDLDGVTKKKRAANDNGPDVSITTCGMCFTIHMKGPVCPTCGHHYSSVAGRSGPKQEDGQLVELTAAAKEHVRRQAEQEKLKARKQRISQEHQCQTKADLIQLGRDRGYDHPVAWADRRWAYIEAARQKRTG